MLLLDLYLSVLDHLLVDFLPSLFVNGYVDVKHEDLVADLVLKLNLIVHQRLIVQDPHPYFLVNDHAQEERELGDTHELGALGVEAVIRPELLEFVDCVLPDLKPFFILGAHETFQDNSDEKVQENERDDKHEAHEIQSGKHFVTAALDVKLSRLWLVHVFVLWFFNALEQNGARSSTVKHNGKPGLSCGHSEQCQQSSSECLEIGVHSQIFL